MPLRVVISRQEYLNLGKCHLFICYDKYSTNDTHLQWLYGRTQVDFSVNLVEKLNIFIPHLSLDSRESHKALLLGDGSVVRGEVVWKKVQWITVISWIRFHSEEYVLVQRWKMALVRLHEFIPWQWKAGIRNLFCLFTYVTCLYSLLQRAFPWLRDATSSLGASARNLGKSFLRDSVVIFVRYHVIMFAPRFASYQFMCAVGLQGWDLIFVRGLVKFLLALA